MHTAVNAYNRTTTCARTYCLYSVEQHNRQHSVDHVSYHVCEHVRFAPVFLLASAIIHHTYYIYMLLQLYHHLCVCAFGMCAFGRNMCVI